MKLLGLHHAFHDSTKSTLDVERMSKCRFRMQRIAVASRSPQRRRILLRCLALPVVTWAGCFGTTSKAQLTRLRRECSRVVRGWTPRGGSRYLLWLAGMRASDDPVWATQYMALRSLVWFLQRKAHRHAWELHLEDEFLASDPLQWSPDLISAFEM